MIVRLETLRNIRCAKPIFLEYFVIPAYVEILFSGKGYECEVCGVVWGSWLKLNQSAGWGIGSNATWSES
jgi:hypothetical protein